MALTERLALLISLDANGAVRGLENVGRAADRNLGKAESRIDRTAQRMQKAGTGMMAASGLAAAGLYKAGQAASDLEQSVGGTEAVFKDAAGTIESYAKTAADKMGLSERAFREATTSIGGNLKRMGFDVDDAAERSTELTQVAADLAATYGGTTAEAVDALGAAFRGEADPAERFNLNLKISAVNAKAVELGLAKTTAEVDENAKAQALLALITEQSADAQGQFAREADTAAGSMQTASAKFEDAKAALGESVAPILADVAGGLSTVADGFSGLNEETDGALSKVLAFGTIGLGTLGGISFVTGKLIEMRQTLGDLGGKLRTADGGFSRLGKTLGALGVAGLAIGFHQWAESMSALNKEASKLEGLGMDELGKELEDIFNAAVGKSGGQSQAAFERVSDALERMAAESPAVVERFAEIAATADGDLAEAMDLAGFKVEDFNSILEDGIDVNRRSGEAQERSTELIDEAVEPTEDLTEATDDLVSAVDKLGDGFRTAADELNGLFDPLFGAVDAMRGMADAQEEVNDAVEAVSDAERAYNEAVKENGRNSEEARDAAEALEDAQRDLIRAKEDTARAALEEEAAMLELRGEVEDGTTSLAEAERKLDDWVAQGKVSEEQADLLRQRLAEVAWTAGAIPKSIGIDINVNRTAYEQAIADLTSIATGGNTRISVGGGGGATLASGGLVPDAKYMAMGGPSGTDTVPAWLTPGEFVMNRTAVDRLGVGMLQALNAGATPSGGSGFSMGDITVQVMPGDDPWRRARRELEEIRQLVSAS